MHFPPDSYSSDVAAANADDQDLAPLTVHYFSPLTDRLLRGFVFACLWLLVGLFITSMLVVLSRLVWGKAQPNWIDGVWLLLFLVVIGGAIRSFVVSLFRRLVFTQHSVRYAGRVLPYEHVALVKVERPEKTLGNRRKLIVKPRRGSGIWLWLKAREAEECLGALRGFCDRAAAMRVDGDVQLPLDPVDDPRSHERLVAAYTRHGWRALAACATSILWWSIVFYFNVLHGNPARHSSSRGLVFVIIMPLAIIAAAFSAFRSFRLARSHRQRMVDREMQFDERMSVRGAPSKR